jgi:hypothetical protein
MFRMTMIGWLYVMSFVSAIPMESVGLNADGFDMVFDIANAILGMTSNNGEVGCTVQLGLRSVCYIFERVARVPEHQQRVQCAPNENIYSK